MMRIIGFIITIFSLSSFSENYLSDDSLEKLSTNKLTDLKGGKTAFKESLENTIQGIISAVKGKKAAIINPTTFYKYMDLSVNEGGIELSIGDSLLCLDYIRYPIKANRLSLNLHYGDIVDLILGEKGSKTGYVILADLKLQDSISSRRLSTIDSLQKEKEMAEKDLISIENALICSERKDSLSIKYAKSKFKKTILKRKIEFGMTKQMVLDSWGNPDDINRMVGSWGAYEQWVYGSRYLFFENGIFKSVQD
jgi:hypothetical protein